MRIDSSAPTRIDLAGGTYDIWPLYLFHDRAQTINAALGLRARCTLTERTDGRVRLVSDDTGEEVPPTDLPALGVDRLPLIARLVRHFGARGMDRFERPVDVVDPEGEVQQPRPARGHVFGQERTGRWADEFEHAAAGIDKGHFIALRPENPESWRRGAAPSLASSARPAPGLLRG